MAASVATIWVLIRIVTHGQEETIVTTACFISHIVWFEMFKSKTPWFSRMVGRVFRLIINLSGRYRIANVICMVNSTCQYLQFPLEKEGQ